MFESVANIGAFVYILFLTLTQIYVATNSENLGIKEALSWRILICYAWIIIGTAFVLKASSGVLNGSTKEVWTILIMGALTARIYGDIRSAKTDMKWVETLEEVKNKVTIPSRQVKHF